MIDYNRFICNIYNPNLPDSDERLISSTADPAKRPALIRFMRDMLEQYEIGEPCETYNCSLEKLKADNIVGVYRCERTKDLGAIKLFGDFIAVKPPVDPNAEPVAKKPFQMNFRKRSKQMYKFPVAPVAYDKNEQLTIDDYVPPKPNRDD